MLLKNLALQLDLNLWEYYKTPNISQLLQESLTSLPDSQSQQRKDQIKIWKLEMENKETKKWGVGGNQKIGKQIQRNGIVSE